MAESFRATTVRQSSPLLKSFCFLLLLCGRSQAADGSMQIPALPIHLDVDGHPLTFEVSGALSVASIGQGQQALRLKLDVDVADLQHNLTDLLRAQLNQNEKCGDRIAVQEGTLVPAPPSGNLTVKLHYEKFACAKALGREITKRLVGGDGTINVHLTPEVDEGNGLRLAAEVTSIDATGQLGEMLRSGSLADALKEKIRRSVVSALQKITDLQERLPAPLREIVEIRAVEFRDGGSGKLILGLSSEVRVPESQAVALLDKLKGLVR